MRAPPNNRRGIAVMVVAMFAFNLSDALTKLATRELPLGEVIFVRGLFATAAVVAAVIATGSWRQIAGLADRRLAARLIGEMGATLFYLMALVHVALPNASAVFQATPLAMTAAAAFFLGERVSRQKWVAIAVGFVGVKVIVRPGLAGFEPHSILVLVSVGFVVLRDISTARLGTRLPTSLVTLATAVSVTLLGLALAPFDGPLSLKVGWAWPTTHQLGLLAATATALLTGYVLLIRATQLAETSAIAPYRYTLLVWAFVYGLLFFGDTPDALTLLGTAIVVATGLYGFRSADGRPPANAS